MNKKCLYILTGLLLGALSSQAHAEPEAMQKQGFFSRTPKLDAYNMGSIIEGKKGDSVKLPGGKYTTYSTDGVPTELLIPNSTGKDFLRLTIPNELEPSNAYKDAHEIRLKAKELASQLLETWPPYGLDGKIAYITTFTPQHDLMMPTPFGQYLREALMFEFNTRGFPVRDFSARSVIINKDGFAYGVSNNEYDISIKNNNALLVTGTFHADHSHLFLNVRLIRGEDGMVLRTAQTIFTLNPLLSRLIMDNRPPAPILSAGELPIVAGKKIK